MEHLGLSAILGVWSDLMSAYYGKASHGDATEIYAYRFWSYNPLIDSPGGFKIGSEARSMAIRSRIEQGVQSILDLLVYFQSRMQCKVIIDGEPLSGWHRRHWDFSHRAIIKIEKA